MRSVFESIARRWETMTPRGELAFLSPCTRWRLARRQCEREQAEGAVLLRGTAAISWDGFIEEHRITNTPFAPVFEYRFGDRLKGPLAETGPVVTRY